MKLIVPAKNIHSHKTRHQKNALRNQNRLLKCNATKNWNDLPQSIIYQTIHGEFERQRG